MFGKEVYFDSLSMFVFFLLTGRFLELRLRDRTAGSLEAVLNRLPDSVERLGADGAFTRVAVRRLVVGDTVTVTLNGMNVIYRAHLPGMPRRGPIAFQSHGCPVEFQNVFVRRLGRESSADERAALEPKR